MILVFLLVISPIAVLRMDAYGQDGFVSSFISSSKYVTTVLPGHVDSDDEIMDAIKENKNYLMNEILGVSIEFGVVNSPYKYNKEIKLDSKTIKIGISVSN